MEEKRTGSAEAQRRNAGEEVTFKPRPECADCAAWESRRSYCGHMVLNGPGTCVLDDPERAEARRERVKRKEKEGKA